MPNRVLRDWTDSEKVDLLDASGERFFTRLIMKVDDYGRYRCNLKLLKSELFPLKTDIRETDISRWLAECEKAGLIALYEVAKKQYLEIIDFGQRKRQMSSKFPDRQLSDNRQSNDGLNRIEKEKKGKERVFKVGNDEIFESVSSYFESNNKSMIDSWTMQHKEPIYEKVLSEMDAGYTGYEFDDYNHLRNAFKMTWKNVAEGKTGNKRFDATNPNQMHY